VLAAAALYAIEREAQDMREICVGTGTTLDGAQDDPELIKHLTDAGRDVLPVSQCMERLKAPIRATPYFLVSTKTPQVDGDDSVEVLVATHIATSSMAVECQSSVWTVQSHKILSIF